MRVRVISSPSELGLARGECVVCVVARRPGTDLIRPLRSVLAHTEPGIPVLVVSGGDTPPSARPLFAGELARVLPEGAAPERELLVVDQSGSSLDAAVSISAPADLALVDSSCTVAGGWLDGLRAAAGADGAVASASAIVLDGEWLCAGVDGVQIGAQPRSIEELAGVVRGSSVGQHPRIRTPGWACVLIRRAALELAGDRIGDACSRPGLVNVVADEVLVSAPAPTHPSPPRDAGVARCLGAAARALAGPSVVIDARALVGPVNGTHVHLLELIAALTASGAVRVRAVVARELPGHAREALSRCGDVELSVVDGPGPLPRGDIVHRPHQVWSPPDLALLRELGERIVITQEDLIGYRNPSYFASDEEWERHRSITRDALALADRVVFLSRHALRDALADDLVEARRADLVRLGVDHQVTPLRTAVVRPAGASALSDDAEFLMCIGTDLAHKNQPFAVRVLKELRRRHGWDGWLIFAGSHIDHGSSAADTAHLLATDTGLSARVLHLGPVAEAEKDWLLSRATAVLYPSVCEGFGLVPFEAADQGVPCIWAPGTAMAELLDEREARIVPWNAEQSADRVAPLLGDEGARERNLAAIRAAASELRWERTATELVALYRECLQSPRSPAGRLEPFAGMSADAVGLMGPGGALPREVERPLLALAQRSRLRAPLFAALKAGYRLARALRRSSGPAG